MASTETFTIGWICAIQEVYEAACAVVDEDLPSPELAEQYNDKAYFYGRIGGHRIVIGCLPSGRRGITPATSLAKDMTASFPQLRFLFMVGTAGGAPTKKRDIRLGDVVVSQPTGTSGGVIQYDMGHELSCEFSQSGHLNSPPSALLAVLPNVKRRHNDPSKHGGIDQHLELLSKDARFQRPENDLLFESNSEHSQGDEDCAKCKRNTLVERKPRNTRRAVNVFYGTVASGNSVWKDAEARDLYCKSSGKKNVLCFEMESAGLMNDFPCIVIRGISNYADSHKNDEWNYYAGAAAAAYAKELLLQVKPAKVKSLLADSSRDTTAEIMANICHRVERIKVLLRGLYPFARGSLIKTKILKVKGK